MTTIKERAAKIGRQQSQTTDGMLDLVAPQHGRLHGDFDLDGRQAWDIEFSSVFDAAEWARANADNFHSIDLRDGAKSLFQTVTVTAVCYHADEN